MRIGIPSETKTLEGRVALVPAAAADLVRRGHEVFIQAGAGEKSGFADEAYTREGVTVVLTTHYLEEAEELCDRIAIISNGRVIADEPTRDLVGKAQEKAVEVTVDRDLAAPPEASCFDRIELSGPRTLRITYRKDRVNAGEVLAAVTRGGLGIVDVSTREADLEDVFLNLTRAADGR